MAVVLFAAASFCSAALTFWLQPLVAKQLLPALGGSPMVWNTCAVFFQATLLAGYMLSARFATTGPLLRWAYPLALIAAATLLPPRFGVGPGPSDSPTAWLLLELARAVAVPALLLSMAAPMLQAWFARLASGSGRDPYSLYASSNAGSFAALICFPLVLQPIAGVSQQFTWWTLGFATFSMLALACTAAVRQPARQAPPAGLQPRAVWRWLVLSLCPSSLTLGVTTYLTTDVGAVPMLWLLPLSCYLLTFVVAFSGWGDSVARHAERRGPLVLTVVAFFWAAGLVLPVAAAVVLHILACTTVTMACHGRLAAERPGVSRLGSYYVTLAAGGVLGGAFNTFIAPLIFTDVLEYPVALLTTAAVPHLLSSGIDRQRLRDGLVFAAPVGMAVAAMQMAASRPALAPFLMAGLGCIGLLVFSQSKTPARFVLGLAALLVGALASRSPFGQIEHRERTFYGTYRVSIDAARQTRALYHGTTLHGLEAMDRRDPPEPLTYYHRDGPFGQFHDRVVKQAGWSRVAVVGLGVGSLASYASPGEQWTFFEIDPAVERIARQRFRFLRLCGDTCDVRIGDARLSLQQTADRFDLIVLDAFSSDSIPFHLVTREAFSLYGSRLRAGGAIAFHISNRHLALRDPLATLARDAGLTPYYQYQQPDAADVARGHLPSEWLVATSRTLEGGMPGWTEVWPRSDTPVWTDDYSDLVAVLRWTNQP